MGGPFNFIIIIATLAAGLILVIKPEKALWNGSSKKIGIIVARVMGTVILLALAAAAFFFYMAWREGAITF